MLSYKKAEDLEFTHGGRDMQAFFTGLLAAAVPILLSLGRIVMAVLAIGITLTTWLLLRAGVTPPTLASVRIGILVAGAAAIITVIERRKRRK